MRAFLALLTQENVLKKILWEAVCFRMVEIGVLEGCTILIRVVL